MAFEMIQPAATPPPDPGISNTGPKATPEAAAANTGTVSKEDALKGAEHTKLGSFSVSDISGGSPGSPGLGSSVSLGGLVQAKVAVDLMDALIPSLLVIGFARFKIATKKTDFGLTQAEKNTLMPIAEACLKSINMDFSNPWQALTFSVIVIYGGKGLEKGGVAFMEKKINEGPATVAQTAPAPVVSISKPTVKPPEWTSPKPSQPVEIKEIRPYDENDVFAVGKKRKKGRQDAIDWLNKNWVKKGGVI